jgi:hypothetical protein
METESSYPRLLRLRMNYSLELGTIRRLAIWLILITTIVTGHWKHQQARKDATANIITTLTSTSAMDAAADPNTKPPSAKSSTTTVFLYSKMRNDRSGMVILDMLMAHAYVYSLNEQRDRGRSGKLKNGTHDGALDAAGAGDELGAVRYVYGGACRTGCSGTDLAQCSSARIMLKASGLEKVLPLACPPPTQPTPLPAEIVSDSPPTSEAEAAAAPGASNHHPQHHHLMDDDSEYRVGRMLEQLEYHEALRKEILESSRKKEPSLPSTVSPDSSDGSANAADGAMKKVTVHIRRGDIDLCGPNKSRYLPNRHYLDLIQEFATNGPVTKHKHGTRHMKNLTANVVIHSEEPYGHANRNASESFEDFTKLGLAVEVNATASQVWQDMLESDVIIMSRSSFSVVPAFLASAVYRTGVSVYTPSLVYIDPMPEWVTVSQAQMRRTKKWLRRLREERC